MRNLGSNVGLTIPSGPPDPSRLFYVMPVNSGALIDSYCLTMSCTTGGTHRGMFRYLS